MDAQRAIELIQKDMVGDGNEFDEADSLAIDALRKQIPMEPTLHYEMPKPFQGKYGCTACDNPISTGDTYCPTCGQRIGA